MKKSFICPQCKKKQTTFIEWQTVSAGYERAVDTGDYIDNTPELVGGDFDNYACPSCDVNLDESTLGFLSI